MAGAITEYTSGLSASAGIRGLCLGPDGNIWFTENTQNKVGKITSAGTITEYSIPTGTGPYGICSDGTDLWVACNSNNYVVKVTTGGSFTEYSLGSGKGPIGICLGPDGNLWCAFNTASSIAKITTGGSVTEYATTTGSAGPFGICSDGTNLWTTLRSAAKICKTTAGGSHTEYSSGLSATANTLVGICLGPDGNVWFSEGNAINKIAKITSAGTITEYATTAADPHGIVAHRGEIWVVLNSGNKIGRYQADGTQVAEYTITTGSSGSRWIAIGGDSNPWFGESSANKLASITGPVVLSQGLAVKANPTLTQGFAVSAVADVTLGALSCDRESRVSGTATVPTGCSSIKVYRSTSSGGTYADVTANCVISGSAPSISFVDKRPAYGSQAIAPGATGYYKVAGVFGSVVGPLSASSSLISDTDREAGERALWARLHALITPGSGYTTYLGSAYPGFYLGSAAYMAKTYSDLTTQALTDLDAWWTEVQTYINADSLFYDGTAPGYISTWRHARLIRDLMTACRELRFLTGNATALALAADITSVVNGMGKAALDHFSTLSLAHQPVGTAGQVTLANVSAWQASHSYASGAVVKPTSSPTKIYRMLSSDGSNKTSGSSEPTWPTTTRGTVQDSGCIWQECTTDLPTWVANTAYTVGQVVRPTSTPPAAITRNATLSSGNTLLTGLSTTSDLEVGAAVSGGLGVITAINSSTTITVSVAPGVSGTFSLTFTLAPRTYRCTSAGTSHASTQPTWPRSNGGTVTDGTVTWTESTRTSPVPYDQYDPTSPYAHQGSSSARISNSLTELAAAYALLYNDGPDSPDFDTGGSYRAAALAQINALIEVCLSQVAAMGGVEQQGVLVQYDSNYASQTMQGLAIITQSMGTGWSMYTEVRNAAGRIADWFDATFETEPGVSNAGQLDGWVQSAGYPQLAEFVWRQSGYQMLGRSQALGTRFVYSSALHPASAYSQAGQASGTQSINSVHMLLEVAFADALGFPAFIQQGLAIAATLSVTQAKPLAISAWAQRSGSVGLGVSAWAVNTKTVGLAIPCAIGFGTTEVGLAVRAIYGTSTFAMNMRMPPGTVVGVYRTSEWIGSIVPVRGAGSYPGTAVVEGEVDDWGEITFDALEPGEYVAWAADFPLRRRFFVVTND